MHSFFEDFINRHTDFHRQLEAAIDGLPQEGLDWVPGDDMNSLCVLVVHVVGAERFWCGTVAFDDPAPRDRDAEFRVRGLSLADLKDALTHSRTYVHNGLAQLTLDDLTQVRDVRGRDRQVRVGWALLHVLDHIALHVGHAQITRQLWDQRNR